MQSFIHKKLFGTFFDVLRHAFPDLPAGTVTSLSGGTARNDAVAAAIAGDLDLERLPDFAATLRDLLTGTVHLIVLDLSRVRVFCPNAVSVLVNFVSFVEGGGKRLVLFRPGQAVRTTLESLNLTHLFEIQQTEEELLLSLPD